MKSKVPLTLQPSQFDVTPEEGATQTFAIRKKRYNDYQSVKFYTTLIETMGRTEEKQGEAFQVGKLFVAWDGGGELA